MSKQAERQGQVVRWSDAVRRHLGQLARIAPDAALLTTMVEEALDWARGDERPVELARATEDPGLTLNRLGDALTQLRAAAGETFFEDGCADLVGGLAEMWDEAHAGDEETDAAAGDESGTWAVKVGPEGEAFEALEEDCDAG